MQHSANSSHPEAINKGFFSQTLVLDVHDSRVTHQVSCLCWCCKTIYGWPDHAVLFVLFLLQEWGWWEMPHLHIAREGLAFREMQKKQFLGVLTSGRKHKGIKIRNCVWSARCLRENTSWLASPMKWAVWKTHSIGNKAGKHLGGGKWKLDGKAP